MDDFKNPYVREYAYTLEKVCPPIAWFQHCIDNYTGIESDALMAYACLSEIIDAAQDAREHIEKQLKKDGIF